MPPIKLSCPGCRTRLAIKSAERLARAIKCPRCKHRFLASTSDSTRPVLVPLPGVPSARSPITVASSPPDRTPLLSRFPSWLIPLAVAVALTSAVILAVLLLPRPEPADPRAASQTVRPDNKRATDREEVGLPAGTQNRGGGAHGREGAEAPGSNQRFALLVGVNAYANLPRLRFPENDVAELAAMLRPAGYQVVVLSDGAAEKNPEFAPTGTHVRDRLPRLARRCGKSDTLLVAFAGHGVQFDEKGDCFFCPRDAAVNDPSTLVSLSQVYAQLGECKAGVRLLLVDACRERGMRASTRGVDGQAAPRPPAGVAALFSCSAGQFSYETDKLDKGHGVFFHYVLEGLRGEAKNRDGEVTWDRLNEYVKKQVTRQVGPLIGGGAQQTPHALADLRGEPPVLLRHRQEKAAPPDEPPAPPRSKEETPAVAQTPLSAAIARGLAGLKKLELAGGSWLAGSPRTEHVPLVGLTLLECGVDKDDSAITALADNLRRAVAQCVTLDAYTQSLYVLFFDRLDKPEDTPLIEALVVNLLNSQNDDGGWSGDPCLQAFTQAERDSLIAEVERRHLLGDRALSKRPKKGKRSTTDLTKVVQDKLKALPIRPLRAGQEGPIVSDNAITQFAALALWVGRRYGVPTDEALLHIDARFRKAQRGDGGWNYGFPGPDPKSTREMTCAAVLSMACGHGVKAGLKREKDKDDKITADISNDKQLKLGLQFLATGVGNPVGWKGAGRPPDAIAHAKGYFYQSLWSLERVCIALNLDTLGKKDWYNWGVEILLANQQADGLWQGQTGEYLADTCYALLFLKRTNLALDLSNSIK